MADADDIAAVLHHRLTTATNSGTPGPRARWIAGLIPEATGPMPHAHRQALHQRRQLIEQRARTLAIQAIGNREAWTGDLGQIPRGPEHRRQWMAQAVAAYRDRYHITAPTALGTRSEDENQRADAARAAQAITTARKTTAASPRSTLDPHHRHPGPTRPDPEVGGPTL